MSLFIFCCLFKRALAGFFVLWKETLNGVTGDMKNRECSGGMKEAAVFFLFLSSGNAVLLVEGVETGNMCDLFLTAPWPTWALKQQKKGYWRARVWKRKCILPHKFYTSETWHFNAPVSTEYITSMCVKIISAFLLEGLVHFPCFATFTLLFYSATALVCFFSILFSALIFFQLEKICI